MEQYDKKEIDKILESSEKLDYNKIAINLIGKIEVIDKHITLDYLDSSINDEIKFGNLIEFSINSKNTDKKDIEKIHKKYVNDINVKNDDEIQKILFYLNSYILKYQDDLKIIKNNLNSSDGLKHQIEFYSKDSTISCINYIINHLNQKKTKKNINFIGKLEKLLLLIDNRKDKIIELVKLFEKTEKAKKEFLTILENNLIKLNNIKEKITNKIDSYKDEFKKGVNDLLKRTMYRE